MHKTNPTFILVGFGARVLMRGQVEIINTCQCQLAVTVVENIQQPNKIQHGGWWFEMLVGEDPTRERGVI